ncbi:ATP-binding protein [Gymnodinialimonas ceratoperidinii]|uniref:histidine kinase n=1 Tax=Gymnodinialimonas ceratoperidinii TaxID=2856823 RepID=A0A8F6YE98_9RHOB|nr:ATP-binding protein [Gymnodinialimonas ceratoperidinii]QXT41002.1 HAMP domain-containing protein [Gymnodinialimonas ceratoperidinii]
MIGRVLFSLRGQLILLLLGVLLAAQIVSLFFFVDERSLAVRAALGFEAAGRAASVARLLEEAPADLHDAILRAANSPLVRFEMTEEPQVARHSHPDGGPVESRIRILLGDQFTREIRVDVHAVEGNILPLPHLSPEMAEMHVAMMRGDLSAIEMSVSISLAGGEWLNVETRFERPPLQWAWGSTLTFVVTASVLLAAGFWFLMARITGPLRRLAVASERLGRGEDMAPVNPTGPTEVRELTAAFGIMQQRLKRFVEDRTRMLAAIGHDLRSPLTALRVRTEMVEDEETRERLTASIEEMQGMLDATLSYARGVSASEPSERMEVGRVLSDINQSMPSQFLILPRHEEFVSVRPFAFRRALRNLIENAQRYGGNARVSFGASDGVVSIKIDDDGEGIPEEFLEDVFAPFQRLEHSRSLDTGGHGLGLSIARSILRAHGGDVVLSNAPQGGLTATITLPTDDTREDETNVSRDGKDQLGSDQITRNTNP